MSNEYVGARLLNIITESLYDKPIVVFREYVQNSADSILKKGKNDNSSIKIWYNNNSLFFLDNGEGINEADFYKKIVTIGLSDKEETKNIGYKGIGRLSGISYCSKLKFINILDFSNSRFQMCSMDCDLFKRSRPDYNDKSYNELIEEICCFDEKLDKDEICEIHNLIGSNDEIFETENEGFLVILEDISEVLKSIFSKTNMNSFDRELGWLLPVDFRQELYDDHSDLLLEFTGDDGENKSIVECFNIYFNGNKIYRPLTSDMLRPCISLKELKYAKGFISFSNKKIAIEKNKFNGIKLYIDNILLCDESEIIPALQNFGVIAHTTNELFQATRGIGLIIYITDKYNILANARRTFIEVSDTDSITFLKEIAEIINNVFDARYALSRYFSAKKAYNDNDLILSELRDKANNCLEVLASNKLKEVNEYHIDDSDISEVDKKSMIKKYISSRINDELRLFISQLTDLNSKDPYEDFIVWLNKKKR